jgi:tRNA-binding EMAP/Myf-like protein
MVRPGAGLEDVLVARVVEAERHPNADRLWLCQVDPGTGEPVQVVCGAPHIDGGGALYPYAPVGRHPPGRAPAAAAKIRGEYSNGMLCSEKELELGKDQAGIMRLPDDLRVGAPLPDALGLDDVRSSWRSRRTGRTSCPTWAWPGSWRRMAITGSSCRPSRRPAPRSGRTPPGAAARAEAREHGRLVGGVRVTIEDPAGCGGTWPRSSGG